MNTLWHEALILGSVLLLLSVILIIGESQDDRHIHGSLFPTIPHLEVNLANGSYSLLFAEQGTLLGTQDLSPLGRCTDAEANALVQALSELTIIEQLGDFTASNAQDYGFSEHNPVIQVGTHPPLTLAAVGDQAFARYQDSLVHLSQNIIPLVQRPMVSLRSPSLELPSDLNTIQHSQGWRLYKQQGRWWRADGTERWVNQNLVNDWIRLLNESKAIAFLDDPGVPPQQRLVCSGANDRKVRIDDLGPIGTQGRIIRRQEQIGPFVVEEFLRFPIDTVTLELEAEALIPNELIPFDPRIADSIEFGELRLQRTQATWTLQGCDLVDRTELEALFDVLGQFNQSHGNRLKDKADAFLQLRQGSHHISITLHDPYAQQLAALQPFQFSDKSLLPNFAIDQVTNLIFTPKNGAPDMFSRDPSADWTIADAEMIVDFLQRIKQSEVVQWHQRAKPTEQKSLAWDAVIFIGLSSGEPPSFTIRLRADGTVAIDQRQLIGQLSPASMQDLLE